MPNLSFAIKCPIEDLESKPFPDLEALEKELIDSDLNIESHDAVDSDTHKEIKGIRYFAFSKINGDDIKVNY